MDDLSYTTIIELAEPLARRPCPAVQDLDRQAESRIKQKTTL